MSHSATEIAVIILAAGKGTRMKSDLPKVLHPIAGQPMLWHVLTATRKLNPARTLVVTGHGADAVEAFVASSFPGTTFVRQTEQKGTGHAVRVCQDVLKDFTGTIVILYGDILLNARPDVLPALMQVAAANPTGLSMLSADLPDATGFGRLFESNGRLVNVEEKDCSPAQKTITTANPCIFALSATLLWDQLGRLTTDNAQQEYYLTDIIAGTADAGLPVRCHPVAAQKPEVGVNTRAELAAMETLWQQRTRTAMMLSGVTLLDPASVYFATDTAIAPDVTVHQNVIFGPGVTIESGAEILPFCHIAGATIRKNAKVGPFARLRPTSEVAEDAKVGNFVELKNAILGPHSQAGHLSYLGDVTIGSHSNIGASTVTANYKHKTHEKFKTTLGDHVSTGSHTTIVAPATLEHGATTGASTVVRGTLEAGSLLVSTPAQIKKSGYNPQ